MGLYESMELEVIAIEQGWRVANNHVAADLAQVIGGRSPDGVWSLCSLMFTQVCNGLSVRVRSKTLSKRRYMRTVDKWMPNPALLREKWS